MDEAEQARKFLKRVLPWAPLGDPGAYFNIHYPTTNRDEKSGRNFFSGRAAHTVDKLVEELTNAMRYRGSVGDMYFCMSSQRMADARTANGYSYVRAIKGQGTAVHLRSLVIDIDVKEDAYTSQHAAVLALKDFINTSSVPKPTLLVSSGTGGLHVYWTLDTALTREEWQPLADALAQATRTHGLMCDTQCTVDAARIMRVPGTFNHKTVPPSAVKILGKIRPDDYSPELMRQALAPYMGTTGSLSPASGTSTLPARTGVTTANSELTAGLEREARPVLLETVAESCGFIREALETGGAAFANPLWNLTALIGTFAPNGPEIIHTMSSGHAAYDENETSALYERKLKEREIKGLGWPACASIQNAGCTHCAACPHFAAGKSPLHLGRVSNMSAALPQSLPCLSIADLPCPPPREWVHGVDSVRGNCSLVVSPGGRGKSSFLIALGLACATGRPLLGQKVYNGPHSVLYLNTEDGTEEVARRVRAAQKHFGLTDDECSSLRLAGVDRIRLTLLGSTKSGFLINETAWYDLKMLIAKHKPTVLILDPLANLSAHTLNDNSAATALMSGLTRLAVENKMSILIAHHTSKGRDLASQEAAMGASAIVNSARVALSIETLVPSEAQKIGVLPSEAGSFFRVTGVKANLSRPSSDDRWHRIVGVNLGNATAEYPSGDTVQVVEPYRPNHSAAPADPAIIAAALSAVEQADPILSDDSRAKDRWVIPAIIEAITRVRELPFADEHSKLILAYLKRQGLIAVAEIDLPRGKGRSDKRKGLVLTEAGRRLTSDNVPQSPHSPAVELRGNVETV